MGTIISRATRGKKWATRGTLRCPRRDGGVGFSDNAASSKGWKNDGRDLFPGKYNDERVPKEPERD